MYEDQLEILDNQIARAKSQLKKHGKSNSLWDNYQLERKIKVYEDMRLDLLVQIANAEDKR